MGLFSLRVHRAILLAGSLIQAVYGSCWSAAPPISD
jgi:hypothetical protein